MNSDDGIQNNEIDEPQSRGTAVMRLVVDVDGEVWLRMERPLRRSGWGMERVPIQELAAAFTGRRSVPELAKGTIKTVRRSGSSLTCNLTRELKELGLKEGDEVEITLRKVRR